MADKRTEREAPGNGRRKRAAPTIDLTATEVEADAAKPEQQTKPAAPAAAEPAPAPAATEPAAPASESNPAAPAAAASAQTTSEPPPEPPTQPAAEMPSRESRAEAEPPHAGRAASYAIALAAGIVGALVAAGALVALWYGGMLALPSNGQAAKIAALEQQVKALRNQPPPAPDSQAIDALRARVERLADTVAKLPPSDKTVSARLTAAETSLKAFGVALTALEHRNDATAADARQARQTAEGAQKAVSDLRASLQDIAKNASGSVPAAALDALQKRVAALDALQTRVAALDALQTRVAALEHSMHEARAKLAENSATDQAARLALSAAALRDAVESGEPFAAELAQAKAFGADGKTLAPLARFADQGVPGKPALGRELSALIPAMLKASGQATPSGSFLDRLQANARKLVRIEPVTAPQGNAPADVLARVEVDAAKADIDGALAELAKLTPAVRAPAQAWIAQVKARQAALAAARRFAADTARALAKP